MKHFWGGVALGDYRCLGKVIRQLPKSFSWNRRWAHELWVMASTWNQKNTWGRAKLLIIQHHKENQEKCGQFISVSLQSHPLNVTLSNVHHLRCFSIFNRKMWVLPKAWTQNLHGLWRGLCQYLKKTLWIYELCKKIKSTHPPDARKSARCHGQMQGQHSINCAGWLGAGT